MCISRYFWNSMASPIPKEFHWPFSQNTAHTLLFLSFNLFQKMMALQNKMFIGNWDWGDEINISERWGRRKEGGKERENNTAMVFHKCTILYSVGIQMFKNLVETGRPSRRGQFSLINRGIRKLWEDIILEQRDASIVKED